MKISHTARGLTDAQLGALVESLPEGMGLFDEATAPVWMNREARRLASLRGWWDPEDRQGTALGLLIPGLIASMPTYRMEQHARCEVEGREIVRIVLRRVWGTQVAMWLHGSRAVESELMREEAGRAQRLTQGQLIVAERLLDEAVVGVAAANDFGQLC